MGGLALSCQENTRNGIDCEEGVLSYTQGLAAVLPEKQQRADPVFPQADVAVDHAAGGAPRTASCP